MSEVVDTAEILGEIRSREERPWAIVTTLGIPSESLLISYLEGLPIDTFTLVHRYTSTPKCLTFPFPSDPTERTLKKGRYRHLTQTTSTVLKS